jgi:hypothetical protein
MDRFVRTQEAITTRGKGEQARIIRKKQLEGRPRIEKSLLIEQGHFRLGRFA